MAKNLTRTQSWHLPFICLIALFSSFISYSRFIGEFIQSNVLSSGSGFEEFKFHGVMVSIVISALYLFVTRKMNYELLFKWTLKLAFGLLILSYLFLSNSKWGLIIFQNVLPGLFLLLGWSYLNDMFSLSGARKSYFAIIFFSALLVLPLVYIPLLLGFGNKLITDGIFGIMLLGYVLVQLNIRWINSQFVISQKVNYKNFSITTYGLSLLACGVLLCAMKWSSDSLFSSFKNMAKGVSQDGVEYITFMEKSTIQSGVLGLFVYAFVFFKGAFLVKKLGWLKAMAITPFTTGLLFVLNGFIPNLFVMNLSYALISSLQGILVFPLVMIVFLAFSTKDRFRSLGVVLLVIQPVLEYIFQGRRFYFASAFAVSFGLIIVYLLASYYLSKKVMTPALEAEMRK